MYKYSEEVIIHVLLQRFLIDRLPRVTSLQSKLDEGYRLSEYDIDYLSGLIEGAQHLNQMAKRHPKYRVLASQIVTLYSSVINHALENEDR